METYNQEKIFEILSKKSEDKFIQIQRILSKMDSHEIAHCLESTPSEQRKVIWSIIDKSNEADVLSELGEEIQQDLFDEISNEELLDLVQNLELDEMVDILQNLPQQRISFLLSKMTKIDRERVEMVLEYPEDSAGGLLNNDIISVQQDSTLNLVLEYLRSIGDIPENTVLTIGWRAHSIPRGQLYSVTIDATPQARHRGGGRFLTAAPHVQHGRQTAPGAVRERPSNLARA